MTTVTSIAPCIDPECVCSDQKPYESNAGTRCISCFGLIGGRTRVHEWEMIGEYNGITIMAGKMVPISKSKRTYFE